MNAGSRRPSQSELQVHCGWTWPIKRFFLGTHYPSWFRKTHVPLFVSRWPWWMELSCRCLHRRVVSVESWG